MSALPELKTSNVAVTPDNVAQLKVINQIALPVRYQEKFYKDIVSTPEDFTHFAFWNGFSVGAVCCRLETKEGVTRLYVMTLAVLPAYRNRNVGSNLVQSVLDACPDHTEVTEVYLHVQTNNDLAINFYKRFGFEISETIPGYYQNIEPTDCYVLTKKCAPAPEAAE
jgi:N-alpha-acetyltransferase 50